MHIILVSDRLATAKTLVITPRLMLGGVLLFIILVLASSAAVSYLSVQLRLPFAYSFFSGLQQRETERTQVFVRDNLKVMAVRLGQMQAEMMRLDSLGERLSALSGLKGQEKPADKLPRGGGQGGPLQPVGELFDLTTLDHELEQFSRKVEQRNEVLSVLEAQLMEQRFKKNLLPTTLPVAAQWNASAFGVRIDPFTGQHAMHDGVDFVANVGTPIVAAAGGVVVVSELHSQYGNMVEVDHGNGLSTRYAHASRVFVKQGQVVKRGQKIAEVGVTGRTTGPHLHFEVRFQGVAQNPARFLQQAQSLPQLASRR